MIYIFQISTLTAVEKDIILDIKCMHVTVQ